MGVGLPVRRASPRPVFFQFFAVHRLTNILKPTAALGAVLLSLSMQVQHAGVFCYLGACGESTTRTDGRQTDSWATPTIAADRCCSDEACRADRASTRDQRSAPGDVPCPCPEGCWCQQVPAPLEMPKLFEASDTLTGHGVFAADTATVPVTAIDTNRATGRQLTLESEVAGRANPCARFCRFLI